MTDTDGDDGAPTDPEWYTKRFWEALRDGRFLVGDCADCGAAHFPPAPVCPRCGADAGTTEADGTGTLYSYARQHRTPPGFESPITVGTVELAEGPRVLMRIEVPDEGAYDRLGIGVDVEVVATEYREEYDRGELSGYPMFAARPV